VKDDNKNFLLFAVLAALILFGWPLIQNHFFPTANPPATKIEDGKSKALPNPGADPTADGPKALRTRQQVLAESPRVRIDTPSLQGSLNLRGGRIDDLVLVRYKETLAKDSPPIRLFSPSGAPDAYFAGFGWSGDGVAAPGRDTLFTADAPVLTPARPVTLAWRSPAGQRFALRIAVDDRYMFTVTQVVGNGGVAPVSVRPFALVSRVGHSKDLDTWTNHTGPVGAFGRGANYDVSFANLDGERSGVMSRIFGNAAQPGENYFDATGGWLGFGDKYWLAALIPDQRQSVHSGFRPAGPKTYQADFALAPRTLAPGRALATTTRLFAGAKEVNLLDDYEDALGIRHFGKAIDWGWFEVVEKPFFQYLDWLFRLVGNFGVAIILLTLTVRALMFPIAQRQFASMAAMRAIQPKMKAIQERYKDDRQKQQQEIMALYKQERVNPLAGCLPTFLQIPVFYALYKVLLLTIEMRHQPFALWIHDLSAPDPLTPVNLFGFLAFTPPAFLAIGVVPILLGVSMYYQFKLNPAPMDEAQKQVFALMPWVLMFIMAPFAVGLQIYWITSNVLTILQQRLLYARHPQLREATAK
jgi:YidC/Oxa1 family membrane protein insertase